MPLPPAWSVQGSSGQQNRRTGRPRDDAHPETPGRQPQRNRHPRVPLGHELGIRTVAIYSHEDRFALHRFKADEAYRVGNPGEPIRAYLDVPGIVELAKSVGVDAIHPGYGFLSENATFARACAEAGIQFVGPRPEVLEQLGDKVTARAIAQKANVPVLSGGDKPVSSIDGAKELAAKLGYPVIIKASMGGGGRGMRVVHSPDKLEESIDSARREAGTAFGVSDVFLEKFVQRAKHIEVQLIGDRHGGLVHLFERDCSIQRRHQKVVELAPAPNLPDDVRQGILAAALSVGRACGIDNAGTVEFLWMPTPTQVLLHRGQPAHPGRAHGHGGSHRRRHRPLADPDRRRRPHRRSGIGFRQSDIT
jgi:pyruvate carboxylase